MSDTWSSPLSERYASPEMLELWSANTRYGLWRRLWLALAEGEKELGVDIPSPAIDQMRANVDAIDFDAVSKYERSFRHDVMAHVHAFGDAAPAAKPFIHLGATSAYVTDNADLILMRRGLEILEARISSILTALTAFARKWKDEPTLGYTHLQPAQLTTVGKRATLWMQDLVLDLQESRRRRAELPLRGVKGTTGTQATFLDLFRGDHEKVRRLERIVAEKMGFVAVVPVTGQTYTRKIDAMVLSVVAGASASAAKFSADLRMLQSFGEMEEPFEPEQIGSSAMPYKRNPMRCERIAALSRFVITLEVNANLTHSVQFLERTLDDSANRRLVIPESFLATDAVLILMDNVVRGLRVNTARIAERVAAELPLMATERIILRAVSAGTDRQKAHEVVRRHSAAAGDGQSIATFLDRLAADAELGLSRSEVAQAVNPNDFIGRAPQQVEEFLDEVVGPLLEGQTTPRSPAEIRV
ncbi:MAG TPA: adenylosuccinate lyase [Gemmatimonadaceae bacterium]|jgi:adenylosuccinate lyase